MKEILFTSVLIIESIQLDRISDFFKFHKSLRWKDYIVIKKDHLQMILRYEVEGKAVYIFDFGAITFINMNINEMRIFIDYLQSIIGSFDYNLFMNTCESHIIKLFDDGNCLLCKTSTEPIPFVDYILPITAEVLAQSVAMERIERVLSQLLADSELMLIHLSKGRQRAHSKKIAKITTKIIKFQYDSIKSIHIFDRIKFTGASLIPREVHEQLANYYELYDRFHIIESKSKDLLNIYDYYSDLGDKKIENRLYKLEVLLLSLFPLKYLVGEHFKTLFFQISDCFSRILHVIL